MIDALECPKCQGRMRLIAMVIERASIRRLLTGVGERATRREAVRLVRRADRRGSGGNAVEVDSGLFRLRALACAVL